MGHAPHLGSRVELALDVGVVSETPQGCEHSKQVLTLVCWAVVWKSERCFFTSLIPYLLCELEELASVL